MHALRDALDRRRDGRDRDPGRIAQQLVGQLADLARHGGREEQVLALAAASAATMRRIGGRKPRSSIWSASSSTKTSVPASDDTALGDVVEQPARRGDQHVDAARQRLDLRAMADAAEHDGDGEAEMAAVGAEALGDLRRKLAGRATAPARGSPCAGPGGGRRPGGGGSAARMRRSCRCRSGRCRAGRGRPARSGWPWPGWAWAVA